MFRVVDRWFSTKTQKFTYLLLYRCVSLQRKSETHCFTATKAIGPTSPVFRCFCEAESEIVVFRVADRCSSTKTQKIIYLLLYKCISCVIGFCRNGLLYLLLCNLFLFQICERRSQFRSICIILWANMSMKNGYLIQIQWFVSLGWLKRGEMIRFDSGFWFNLFVTPFFLKFLTPHKSWHGLLHVKF